MPSPAVHVGKPSSADSIQVGNLKVQGCGGFGPKLGWKLINGRGRGFSFYLPQRRDAPLWLVFHGTKNQAPDFLRYSRLHSFSIKHGIGILAPQGLPNQHHQGETMFNVGRHSQAMPEENQQGVHDLVFVRQLLEQVLQSPCIDRRRIHCTGYSNGARFCIRLASEMSQVIASVAAVEGLRYPEPNHASRPVPILAFHGERDLVNPWQGHGDVYWEASVPDALQHWAKFNQCRFSQRPPELLDQGQFSVAAYGHCKDEASVQLIRLSGAGHQWPHALWPHAGLGPVSPINGNVLIREFFSKHRLPVKYLTPPQVRQLSRAAGHSSAGACWLGVLGLAGAALVFWAQRRTPYHQLAGTLLTGRELE